MSILRGKVLDIVGKKVIVEVKDGVRLSKKKVNLRPGVEIKRGSKVIIAFNTIIDKIR